MSLVSVYLPHICISNGEKRRLIAASIVEILKKYSRSSYFGGDSSNGTQDIYQTINQRRLPTEWYLYFFSFCREAIRNTVVNGWSRPRRS